MIRLISIDVLPPEHSFAQARYSANDCSRFPSTVGLTRFASIADLVAASASAIQNKKNSPRARCGTGFSGLILAAVSSSFFDASKFFSIAFSCESLRCMSVLISVVSRGEAADSAPISSDLASVKLLRDWYIDDLSIESSGPEYPSSLALFASRSAHERQFNNKSTFPSVTKDSGNIGLVRVADTAFRYISNNWQ